MKITSFVTFSILIIGMLLICGCVDPYYSGNNGGYRDPGYGGYNNGGYNSGYDGSYDDRRERDRLERERRRLEDERRRLEDERRNRPVYSQPPVYTQPRPIERPREHCPPGFSPSENKCSTEERRRGCKDMRLPGGLGCVSR